MLSGSSRRSVGWPHLIAAATIAVAAFAAGARWGTQRGHRAETAAPAPLEVASARSQPVAVPLRALPMPAEFEPQSALFLVCNELVPNYPAVFRRVVAAAHRSVPIVCLVSGEKDRADAVSLLREEGLAADAVRFVLLDLDTMWVRDYGPVFIRQSDDSVTVADLDYLPADSGMEARWRDNDAPRLLGGVLGLPVSAIPLRLEGGNLLSNGDGLCVTTTAVIARNADRGYDPRKIQLLLGRYLGIRDWLCLQELVGEQTGHVDMFVTFVAADVAVVGQIDSATDPTNARILDDAAMQLSRQMTSRGPVQVHRVPLPVKNDGLWRSYTNVIYANGTLLVPTFSDVDPATEDKVLGLYRRLLPGWRVVGVNADSMANSEGLLHCISLNVPRFVPLEGLGTYDANELEVILQGSRFTSRSIPGVGWSPPADWSPEAADSNESFPFLPGPLGAQQRVEAGTKVPSLPTPGVLRQ